VASVEVGVATGAVVAVTTFFGLVTFFGFFTAVSPVVVGAASAATSATGFTAAAFSALVGAGFGVG
jgi:hypothetical protein